MCWWTAFKQPLDGLDSKQISFHDKSSETALSVSWRVLWRVEESPCWTSGPSETLSISVVPSANEWIYGMVWASLGKAPQLQESLQTKTQPLRIHLATWFQKLFLRHNARWRCHSLRLDWRDVRCRLEFDGPDDALRRCWHCCLSWP